MSKLPLRAFIAYTVEITGPKFEALSGHESKDPTGASWRTMGMVPPLKGEKHVMDLEGVARIAAVQFNERILPSKVRDEHVGKRVMKLMAEENRAVSKKEYAQIRDEVELELLPKAFIRRTVVPLILFTAMVGETKCKILLVCTSSQKKADDIIAVLRPWCDIPVPTKIGTVSVPLSVFTTLARHGGEDYEDDSRVEPTNFAVLKGKEKRTIRIKDKDVSDHDIETLLKQDYEVQELGLAWSPTGTCDGDDGVEFVCTTNLTFKSIKLPGVKRDSADEFAYITLFASTMKQFLPSFINGPMGGMVDFDEL